MPGAMLSPIRRLRFFAVTRAACAMPRASMLTLCRARSPRTTFEMNSKDLTYLGTVSKQQQQQQHARRWQAKGGAGGSVVLLLASTWLAVSVAESALSTALFGKPLRSTWVGDALRALALGRYRVCSYRIKQARLAV